MLLCDVLAALGGWYTEEVDVADREGCGCVVFVVMLARGAQCCFVSGEEGLCGCELVG